MRAEPPSPSGAGAAADLAPFDLPLSLLRRRTSIKWRAAGPEVLPLWVAEMDVMPAEEVVAAVRSAVELGDTGYACGTGYAEAAAAFAEARWGSGCLDPARSALVPDVMLGVVEVLGLVTGVGSTVVVTPPVYPPFYAFAEHHGRKVLEVPLDAAGRLDLEALGEAFERAGAASGSVFLLSNPHNPTGTVHTTAELTALAALAEAAGVRVVADEIHSPLVLAGATFTPFLSVPGSGTGFSLFSASKAWNLAGLKAAVAFAGPDAAGDLARLPEEVGHGVSHLGVIAHSAALRHGGGWLDAALSGLDRNRRLLGELLGAHLPEVRWRPPEATFLAWLDCAGVEAIPPSHLGAPAAVRGDASARAGAAAWWLEQAGVLLSSGPAFGPGGESFVRLNFATSASVLDEALSRMGRAVAGGC